MKKILFKILILVTFTSCGFTPVYIDNKNVSYNINILEINGDQEINQFMTSKLKKYSGKNLDRVYDLEIVSEFLKTSLAKDSTGRTSDFKLSIKVIIDITYNDKNQKYIFNESINIKNDTDSFEQRNYEKTIKENFASSTVDKLIIKISSIK